MSATDGAGRPAGTVRPRPGEHCLGDSRGSVFSSAPARRWSRFLSVAAVLAITKPFHVDALAADLVPPDPWEVIHVAREFGPAEVGRDGMGDPQISGTIDGLAYRVTFYGCRLGRECDTILFDARFSRNQPGDAPPPAQHLAGWNSAKLFGRAWLDGEGRLVLDHAVALGPGVPKPTLHATFERWKTALSEYAGRLGIR